MFRKQFGLVASVSGTLGENVILSASAELNDHSSPASPKYVLDGLFLTALLRRLHIGNAGNGSLVKRVFQSQLEILDILPPEQTAALLERELDAAGFEKREDGQWARAKGFDSFAPLGPWIETEADPAALQIRCEVDGEVRQSGSTSEMIRSVAELVAAASAVMTLLPGDVILTGTPAGVGRLAAGNRVNVSIEGLGTLSNPVVADD